MKSEPESSSTHTITINGQQYQIVSPAAEALQALTASGAGMAAASSRSHSSGNLHYPTTSNRGNSRVVSVSGSESETGLMEMVSRSTEESARKREIRLLKNREAARECRTKKKEYIKCLENRVAVLENQNKALIEELKTLKELYTGQKM